ncbi:hypothetical protein LAWI1_G000130 [Lachnellula willkommii]|uniref:VWFA domain-containing protein n=1 Tax=Lachnellula willkommii TaxID=215461 RepID=A0A559MMZ2_9HELO|nr:hypothetical protein LAWI1_G000130 [Lachnellula willkommii]
MPTSNPWTVPPPGDRQSRSLFGSLRKIGRKSSKSSQRSDTSSTNGSDLQTPTTPTFLGPSDLPATLQPGGVGRRSPSPLSNPSPATRRPDRPGMNAFTVPSNEPPPAYTPAPTPASGPILPSQISELPGSSASASAAAAVPTPTTAGGEDPYSFLATFDTTLLIDDSGSMAGRSWREVSQALSTIAPIVTQHDADGIDVYFLNHKSSDAGSAPEGIAPGGYRCIKRAGTISEIFDRVRPAGGTPTGTRVHNILKPYLARLERDIAADRETKPLNLIVLTDGVPSDDVESVILSAAKKLDRLDATPYQIGVQFFQVGNEEGAREALEELDDHLGDEVEGGVRDIVDTVTWTGGRSSSEGGVGLTGDGILKCVLGSVVKRLDRKRASGEVRRTR